MNQHRLIVDSDLILQDNKTEELKHQLFYQMTRLTKDRGSLAFDDRIDALAIAVNYWVEVMDRDAQTALEDYKEEQLDIALEKFMDDCGKTNGNTAIESNIPIKGIIQKIANFSPLKWGTVL